MLHMRWCLNMPCLSSLYSAVSRTLLIYTLFSFLVFLLCSFSLLNYHCSIAPINMRHPQHDQIWQCCNYAIYFIVAWSTTRTNMEVLVSFPVFSVVVCAWSTSQKLRGRPASVGLAQARSNHNTTRMIKN